MLQVAYLIHSGQGQPTALLLEGCGSGLGSHRGDPRKEGAVVVLRAAPHTSGATVACTPRGQNPDP